MKRFVCFAWIIHVLLSACQQNQVDRAEIKPPDLTQHEKNLLKAGESNKTAQQRGVKATQKVRESYEDKNVVIGMHGNIMALIMNEFDSRFDYDFWRQLDIPDIYKPTFDQIELRKVHRVWKRL